MNPLAHDLERRLAGGPDRYFGAPLPALPPALMIERRSSAILQADNNPSRREDSRWMLLPGLVPSEASLVIGLWFKLGEITLEQRHVMWQTLGCEPPELPEADA